jgi:hypothetical protein
LLTAKQSKQAWPVAVEPTVESRPVCIIISLEALIAFFTAGTIKYATATAKERGLGTATRFQQLGSAGHKIHFGQPHPHHYHYYGTLRPRAPPLQPPKDEKSSACISATQTQVPGRMPSAADAPTSKPPTRLKLTMPSPTHSANLEGLAVTQSLEHHPRRPSYSPVTPTFPDGISDADARQEKRPEFIDEPDPLPISLEENSDAIALKAALSILQMQKQQSQRDIKQLDKMKAVANTEPEAFIDALKAGKLNKAPRQAVIDVDDVDDVDDENGGDTDGGTPSNFIADSEKLDCDIGQFPNPQNVVRCPPINWAKYHVVGGSLDKLHEEQRRRPEPGNPRRDEYGRPLEHVIAAPYRPLVDKLEAAPGSTQRESRE